MRTNPERSDELKIRQLAHYHHPRNSNSLVPVADVQPNPRVRPSYNYNNTAEDKYKRERKGRLNANRAALGLDGGSDRGRGGGGGNSNAKEKEKGAGRRNEGHKSGVKYSDPLEAELNKFRERAKREESNKKLDDIAVRTYSSMWVGFESLGETARTKLCLLLLYTHSSLRFGPKQP